MGKPIIIDVDKERMITGDTMHKAYTGLGIEDSVYGIHNIDDVLIFAPVDTDMDTLMRAYGMYYNSICLSPVWHGLTGRFRQLGRFGTVGDMYELYVRE